MSPAGLGLLKWPVDVLLYMLRFSSLEDSLSFSMICMDMYTLAAQKSFWITALKNERQIRPIACPYHEDITLHDIHSLRRIALHTRRLERNWESENPQVLGQIKTVSLGFPTVDILFQVPGTELYVFHCHIRGIVELWHIGLGKIVSGPISISTEICDISQAEDLPGRLTMALLVRKEETEDSYQIALICVEYGRPDVFALTIPSLVDLPDDSQNFYWAVFLDHDIFGALCYTDDAMKLCVWAVNRTTGKDTFIVTDLPNAETPRDEPLFHSGTTAVDGNLCILVKKSCIFTVPNSHLPRDDNPECSSMSIFRFEGNFGHFDQPQTDDEDVSFLTILTASSPYGVFAMSVNVVSPVPKPIPSALEVTFWTRPEPTGEETHLLAPLTSERMPGFFYTTVEGADSSRWERVLQTLSGRRGLVLLNMRDKADDNDSRGRQILRLVSCERHRAYRDLILPDFIDLFSVCGLFLDDHLGVVSMIDSEGILYTIPYA